MIPRVGGNRNIDYAIHVFDEVKKAGRINQSELTTAVWGTSGTNNATLVNVIMFMVSRKWLNMDTKGRSKIFSIGSVEMPVEQAAE